MTEFTLRARREGFVAFAVDTFPSGTIYTDTPVMFVVTGGGPFFQNALLQRIDFVRDISFSWDYGDEGATFRHEVWDSDANFGYGIGAMHAWDTPGTYEVTLTARKGSEVQTQTISVTVAARPAPDKLYAVSFDGNFTGAPAGATQISSWSALLALSDTFRNDSAVEMYFRRGETFDIADTINFRRPSGGHLNVLIDSYGSGNLANLQAAGATTITAYSMFRAIENTTLVIKGIAADGLYNVLTGKYSAGHVTGINANHATAYVALNGCDLTGLADAIVSTAGSSCAMYDCEGVDAAAYTAIFCDGANAPGTAWAAVAGCRLAYDPMSLRLQDGISGGDDPDATQGAHVRVKGLHRFIADNNKVLGSVGWSGFGGANNDAATQPAFRAYRDGCAASHIYSITRADVVGHLGGISTQYPASQPMLGDGRWLIDRIKLTIAGTPQEAPVLISAGGVAQNISCYLPNTFETGGTAGEIAYALLSNETGNPQTINDQPALVRAITMVSDRSVESGGLGAILDTDVVSGGGWTGQDITVVDCVMHAPNHPSGVSLEPMSRGDNFAPRSGTPIANATNPPVYDIDGTLRTGTTLQGAHHAVKADVPVSAVTHSGDGPSIAKFDEWETAYSEGIYALTSLGSGYSNENEYLIENNWSDASGQFGGNSGRTWAIDDSRMGTPDTWLQNSVVLTNRSGVRVTVASNVLNI